MQRKRTGRIGSTGRSDTTPLTTDGERKRLLANPANPRQPWAAVRAEEFRRSLEAFGDLSGIVENKVTGRLVGGHKRTDQFAADPAATVTVTERLAEPDATGTLAYGYVTSMGTRWAYRLVDWPEAKEAAANLAANQWGAEWDMAGVRSMLASLDGTDLALTGFDAAEVERLTREVQAPAEFGKVDENIETEHQCPKCGYKFSGGKAGPKSE